MKLLYVVNVVLDKVYKDILLLLCDMHRLYATSRNKWNAVCPSQTWIGRKLGYCREWINKKIKDLTTIGLLSKKRRFNRTSIYTPSPWLSASASALVNSVHNKLIRFKRNYIINDSIKLSGGRKIRFASGIWKILEFFQKRDVENPETEVPTDILSNGQAMVAHLLHTVANGMRRRDVGYYVPTPKKNDIPNGTLAEWMETARKARFG